MLQKLAFRQCGQFRGRPFAVGADPSGRRTAGLACRSRRSWAARSCMTEATLRSQRMLAGLRSVTTFS